MAGKQSLIEIRFKPWKAQVVGVVPQRLPFLRLELLSAEERRDKAALAIRILGPQAKPAIPRLVELLNGPETVLPAITALSGVGPEVIPILATVATNRDVEVRRRVEGELTQLALGPGAKAYAPQLVPIFLLYLNDEDYLTRAHAAGAFAELADAVTAIPVLMHNLRDTNTYVRAMTVQALGTFGNQAKAAVPCLLDLATNEDAFARDRAIWALKRIDPEAAAKVGVK